MKHIDEFLPISDRPSVYGRSPPSGKFNAVVGGIVSLSFYFRAIPAASTPSSWRFVNTNGSFQNLPNGSSSSSSSFPYSLAFRFASEAYYGNYSITLNNTIGSTTETFQVLPPGKYISYIF